MNTRRNFLQGLPACAALATSLATSPATAGAQAVAADAVRLDALCYYFNGEVTGGRVARVLRGGLTAAVFDLNALPRDYNHALRALQQWQAKFNAPGSRVLAVREAADVRRAQRAKRLGIILACQDAASLGEQLDEGLQRLQ